MSRLILQSEKSFDPGQLRRSRRGCATRKWSWGKICVSHNCTQRKLRGVQMPNPAFVHLRLHSEFSVTDGIVRIDEAVARAKEDGMPALAITDLANVFGVVKFYKAARAAGVKPVIGCDVWIANESERDKPHRLLLLTQSRPGYLRLAELLTRAWLENQYRGRAELNKSWFAEGTEGLIALSGAMQGSLGVALVQDHREQAERLAQEWANLFPGRFYLELQRAGAPQTEDYNEAAVRLAGALSLPVVATP